MPHDTTFRRIEVTTHHGLRVSLSLANIGMIEETLESVTSYEKISTENGLVTKRRKVECCNIVTKDGTSIIIRGGYDDITKQINNWLSNTEETSTCLILHY